jgi:hypothetical protein
MGCTDEEFDNAHRCTKCGVTGGGVENEMCEECFISRIGELGMNLVQCEQKCGNHAVVYAGDKSANGWAGYFCSDCVVLLGFSVWSRYPSGIIIDGMLIKEEK